uniref:NADH dehydrogenase subunit 4L n=1 Tax=Evania appendigaster TaxID=27486 RepID=C8YLY3_EVAAP|nr:NADH dehydrogenase subunit 4L [Evania appendigaster]ACL36008.1 NADH dehydrogenase subunit 4L [Evania appendigaster]
MMFFMMMYMLSFYIFFIYEKVLIVLLLLEFMMLSVLGILYLSMNCLGGMMFLVIYYMVFVVGEGVLGLSLLVSIMRYSGKDYIKIMSLGC